MALSQMEGTPLTRLGGVHSPCSLLLRPPLRAAERFVGLEDPASADEEFIFIGERNGGPRSKVWPEELSLAGAEYTDCSGPTIVRTKLP